MLSFNVLDDLKEARDVLSNFIEQADTKEVIEKSVQMMVSSIKNGGKIISAGKAYRSLPQQSSIISCHCHFRCKSYVMCWQRLWL